MLSHANSQRRRSFGCRQDTDERMFKVCKDLSRHYGDFSHYNRKNPLEELLFILCSVQTQESKYRKTYATLRQKFPKFSDLAAAKASAIAKTLRFGGLSRTKSKLIERICRKIMAKFGKLSLAPLATMGDAECETFLISLPGVGFKVARCVMMYSLGRAVFPVDTHCWRVCRRLGWVRATTRDKVCRKRDMDRLQEKIPATLRYSLHVNLISLGRETCINGRPRCALCPLNKLCRRASSSRVFKTHD